MAQADQPTRPTGRLAGLHPIGGGLTIPPGADTTRSRFGNVTMPRDVMTLGGRQECAKSGRSVSIKSKHRARRVLMGGKPKTAFRPCRISGLDTEDERDPALPVHENVAALVTVRRL
jgi:hypothetical protein